MLQLLLEVNDYCPTEPYVFKSGRHKGQCAEILMFQDYKFLNRQLQRMQSQYFINNSQTKNELHKHLEWLLARGENRVIDRICHLCKEKPIQYLSILGSLRYPIRFDSYYTCCEQSKCRVEIRDMTDRYPCFIPIKFSPMASMEHDYDRKAFAKFLKEIFNAPKRITRNWAFQFFSS